MEKARVSRPGLFHGPARVAAVDISFPVKDRVRGAVHHRPQPVFRVARTKPMKHAVIALALAGLAAAALPAPADAHCRGCGVAAGVVGGVAVGALIGSALAGPRPVYVEEVPPPPPPRVYYYEEDGRGP